MHSLAVTLLVLPMSEPLARNVDRDVSNNSKVKHAPVVTDEVEAIFGTVGHALHTTIASLHACFGVAMSKRMHCMQSREEIRQHKQKTERKKLQQAGVEVGYAW